MDRHTNFEIDDVTMGGARIFLRFYIMVSPGWGKTFGVPKFSPDHSAPENRSLSFGLSGLGSLWP